MRLKLVSIVFAVLLAALPVGCGTFADREPTLFERRMAGATGVTFENNIVELPDFNIVNYPYHYNGGGVAVGDVNGDGLLDLYFTANEEPNVLYLNRGDFQFEDVTDAAGVAGTADWTMGVTMADVNGDGWLDIYVATVSGVHGLEGHYELYINQGPGEDGVPRFEERAADYGLDAAGYGTDAVFFDYDGDGDLDVYVLKHSTHAEITNVRAAARTEPHPRAGDRLYRNDTASPDQGPGQALSSTGGGGTFTNVSALAGVYSGRVGYGLGISVSDFDRDGYPDLYVANDFHENDYLYFNNGDGTFTETITTSTGHNSLSSMGVDAADINNNGRPDVVVLDMMPAREAIRKTADGNDDEEIYRMKRQYGYHHQLARNTLQLNQGSRRFSEIGLMAGIHATDWSWAPLLADFDNDGWKDLFITNGIYRRPNDLDYIDYVMEEHPGTARTGGTGAENMEMLVRMPQVPIPNYAFQNAGTSETSSGPIPTFADRSEAWGLDYDDVSNGAAYADLDNDGDLDLVVNNLNAPASLYENRADTLVGHHYLTVQLDGATPNTQGLGATVHLVQGERRQLLEQQPVRGFQSSVDPRLHFGLGPNAAVDSLIVVWPDGRAQVLTDVASDQTITLHQEDATETYREPMAETSRIRFTDVTDVVDIDYRHEENDFNDFVREPLMPHKLSTEGPALAVGDVNDDGLDDLFAGGARGQPARLFLQQPDGSFQAASDSLWTADALHEDVDAVFFDADGDGDLDLYVVSAGNEFWGTAEALRDRLYLNDGTGTFRRAEGALPDEMFANGGAVAPADFDDDGDVDLFVGSRVVAREYGATPTSYLLENDGTGRFRDVTDERAPALAEAGMVADATWFDATGDGQLDLVTVGTWMPIRVFAQQDGRFVERTAEAGFAETNGWWNAVHAADLDGDGDTDLVAGNLGWNAMLQATPEEPVRLYRVDADGDGQQEPILTYYNGGVSYPFYGRTLLAQQIDGLEAQFPTHESFRTAQIDDIVPSDRREQATVHVAHTFTSVWAENQGDSTFAIHHLPDRAQIAPLYGMLSDDVDGDGHRDLVAGGNFYGVRAEQGRYDASYGHWLRGTNGGWEAVPPVASGLYLTGQVRALRTLQLANSDRLIVVARNDDRLQILRVQPSAALVTAEQ